MKTLQKIKEKILLPSSFCEAGVTLIPKLDKHFYKKKNYRMIFLMNVSRHLKGWHNVTLTYMTSHSHFRTF